MSPDLVSAYVDPETGCTVAPLNVATAFKLVETLDCVVHLLPHFRVNMLSKYQAGGEEGVYLSGSSPRGGGSTNGMLLYSIERGRRGIVTLTCRILCVQDADVAIGRALIIPTAIMHKATRVVAKIYNKDKMQYSFWSDLGFEMSEEMVQLSVDPAAIAAQRAARSPSAPNPVQEQPEPQAPAPSHAGAPADDLSQPAKKKRGRPSAADGAVRVAVAEQPGAALTTESAAAKSHRRGRKPAAAADSLAASPNDVDEANVPLSPAASRAPAGAPLGEPEPGPDENEDVYIRKACPGPNVPHLIRVPRGLVPPQGEAMWQIIDEEELDGKETLQCSVCSRTFQLSRDQAEVLLDDAQMCHPAAQAPPRQKDPLFEEQPLHSSSEI